MAPISEVELAGIAYESSQAERRADDAERELMEWKKVKFMQDRIGDDFDAMILSVTKYGCFVELDSLFIEGLVPILSLQGDHYTFRENTRQIMGEHSGRRYSMGDRCGWFSTAWTRCSGGYSFPSWKKLRRCAWARPARRLKARPSQAARRILTFPPRTRCCARANKRKARSGKEAS